MSSTTNMSESTGPADQTAAHQNSQYARIDRIISNGDINCSICISPLSIILEALPRSHPLLQTTDATVTCAGFITLPCGHHFGRTCILTWLHHSGRANTNTTSLPTCPLCRARVPRRHAASTSSNSSTSTSTTSSTTSTTSTSTSTASPTPIPIPDPAHLAARLDRIDAIAKALADDEQQPLLALHAAPLQQAARRLEALLRAAPGRAAQLTRGSPVPAEAGRLARLLGAVCEAAPTMRAGGLADAVVGAMWAEDAAEAEARGEVQVVDGQVVLDVMRFVERMVAMILLEEGEEDSGEEEDWETDDGGEGEEEDYEADDESDDFAH